MTPREFSRPEYRIYTVLVILLGKSHGQRNLVGYSPWGRKELDTEQLYLLTYFTSLLQGIFSTQGSNPGLPHCRWILYQLSHKGLGNIKIRVIQFSGKGIISWTEKQYKCNLKVFFFSFSFFFFLNCLPLPSHHSSSLLLTRPCQRDDHICNFHLHLFPVTLKSFATCFELSPLLLYTQSPMKPPTAKSPKTLLNLTQWILFNSPLLRHPRFFRNKRMPLNYLLISYTVIFLIWTQ